VGPSSQCSSYSRRDRSGAHLGGPSGCSERSESPRAGAPHAASGRRLSFAPLAVGHYRGVSPAGGLVSVYDVKINHKSAVPFDRFDQAPRGGSATRLQRWRDKHGLKFRLQPANWPFHPRPADGVVIAALEPGPDPDRYRKTRRRIGVPGKQLAERSGAWRKSPRAYEQNRQDALAADVCGSMCRRVAYCGDRTTSNCWKMR
jgi:hypothetical protein